MIFFLDDFCDTTSGLVYAIESHGLHIVTLFVMPIIVDLCKNAVVGFEEFDAWFPLGVVRHREGVKHLIILIDNLQTRVMDSEYRTFIIRFSVSVAVSISNAEKIFLRRL